jgi:hypothetical protein
MPTLKANSWLGWRNFTVNRDTRWDFLGVGPTACKEHKPPKQSSKNHKELPLHTCKLPLNQCTSPWTNACQLLENRAAATTSAYTGQTGHHHWSDRCLRCAQDQHSHQSDRWPRPVRPVHTRAQKWLETTWKPSKCIQQAISSSNISPCWQCMNQAKNAKLST